MDRNLENTVLLKIKKADTLSKQENLRGDGREEH